MATATAKTLQGRSRTLKRSECASSDNEQHIYLKDLVSKVLTAYRNRKGYVKALEDELWNDLGMSGVLPFVDEREAKVNPLAMKLCAAAGIPQAWNEDGPTVEGQALYHRRVSSSSLDGAGRARRILTREQATLLRLAFMAWGRRGDPPPICVLDLLDLSRPSMALAVSFLRGWARKVGER